MNDTINGMILCCEKLFDENFYSKCYLELADNESIVLSATKEGLLLLVKQILFLIEAGYPGYHSHFDEASIISKCDKPLIVEVIDPPVGSWYGYDGKAYYERQN